MMPKPSKNNKNPDVNKSEFKGFSAEKILLETKPNFWLYSDNFILKIVVLFLLVFMFAPIMTLVYGLHTQLVENFHIAIDNVMFYSELILILLTLIVVIKIILDILDWNYTHYVLTDARVVIERGFLHKEKISISYAKIQDIEIRQSLLERIISVGDIILYGANEYSETILDDIPSPKDVEEIIITSINNLGYHSQYYQQQQYQQAQQQQYPQNTSYNPQITYQPGFNQDYQGNNVNNQNIYVHEFPQTNYQPEQTYNSAYNNNQYVNNDVDVITPDKNNQWVDKGSRPQTKKTKEEILRKHDQMFKRHNK